MGVGAEAVLVLCVTIFLAILLVAAVISFVTTMRQTFRRPVSKMGDPPGLVDRTASGDAPRDEPSGGEGSV
jgi:hypothetical protein